MASLEKLEGPATPNPYSHMPTSAGPDEPCGLQTRNVSQVLYFLPGPLPDP